MEIPLRRVVFGARAAQPALLRGASFAGVQLSWCEFQGVDLTEVTFAGAVVADCDLRRTTFCRSEMQDARFIRCDMYRGTIAYGCSLARAKFVLVSPARIIDPVGGVRWQVFSGEDGLPALIAEDELEYRAFLQRTLDDRPERHGVESAVEARLETAASSYRELAGYWTGIGQLRDAGAAYAHAQRLERSSAGPWFRGRPFRPGVWLGLWIADLTCGFGERLGRVAVALGVLMLLPAFLLWLLGGLSGAGGPSDYLFFSVSRIAASTPPSIEAANRLVEWIAVIQTVVGIALLGLFGFVLGNAVRRY